MLPAHGRTKECTGQLNVATRKADVFTLLVSTRRAVREAAPSRRQVSAVIPPAPWR
jgi:hypothetical protein